MNWHYAHNGQQMGPVTEAQLVQLFQGGRITADTLVWHEGLADWVTYHEAMANRPPPPPDPLPAAPGVPPAPQPREGEVICAECGKLFPLSETVRFGKASVCGACKPVYLQKLSEGATVNTGELNYAGFWIRFAAKFLDGIILGLPYFIIYFIVMLPILGHNPQPRPSFFLLPWMLQGGFYLLGWGYQIFFVGKFGATPGKMACGLKVVTAEGEKVGYARATGRCFAEILSAIICYIGYIMVAFDEEKRGLHDHICNTRVIYKK